MIVKEVKTLFGGLVPVHGKYVEKAIATNSDIKINYQSKSMILANSQLDKPIKKTVVPDKFVKKMNTLYYYAWKPLDDRQGDFLYDRGHIMVKFMLKEASDEVIYLRKLLQKHKADILNEKLSEEEKAKATDNFIRITNIIYAKLDFVKKI